MMIIIIRTTNNNVDIDINIDDHAKHTFNGELGAPEQDAEVRGTYEYMALAKNTSVFCVKLCYYVLNHRIVPGILFMLCFMYM